MSLSFDRVVFVTFVVGILIYLLISKLVNTPVIEKFVDPDALVQTLYKELENEALLNDEKKLYANPSHNEIKFYSSKVNQLTRADLKELIKTTAIQINNKLVHVEKDKCSQKKTVAPAEIIQIYNDILQRNPTGPELKTNINMLETDPTFSTKKLMILLYTSEEYRRLEKTQTNMVNAQIPERMTDREITLVIQNLWQKNSKEPLNEHTLLFLKDKFKEYNLDDEKLVLLIKNVNTPYNVVDKSSLTILNNVNNATNGSSAGSKAGSSAGSTTGATEGSSAGSTAGATEGSSAGSSAGSTAGSTTGSSAGSTTGTVTKTTTCTTTTIDDSSYHNLKSAAVVPVVPSSSKCSLNVISNQNHQNQYSIFDSIYDDRNKEELKNICQRNMSWKNFEIPNEPIGDWVIPRNQTRVCLNNQNDYQPSIEQTALIGTLLDNTKKTTLGPLIPPI